MLITVIIYHDVLLVENYYVITGILYVISVEIFTRALVHDNKPLFFSFYETHSNYNPIDR